METHMGKTPGQKRDLKEHIMVTACLDCTGEQYGSI